MGNSDVPEFGAIELDLKKLSAEGMGRTRYLDLPALHAACRYIDLTTSDVQVPAAILDLMRRAVDTLGGGYPQDAADYLFGLVDGSALWSRARRRERAAAFYELAADTFRKKPERELVAQVAEGVLALCHEASMRQTRLSMEERRHPADSRLAVQWVERFEAYYRIWTPVYALAANLEAALEVYTHEPADHLPWDPDSTEPYDPVAQARGYARSALYNLAQYHLELKRFMTRHGGLWLLSDTDTEQEVADAIYRIGWHNDLTDEDESFLRRHLADSRHEETEHFWNVARSFSQGITIHDRWQAQTLAGVGIESDDERSGSQVWLAVSACHDYTRLIDEDWVRIADWYRPGSTPRQGVSGKTLYDGTSRKRLRNRD